MIYTFCYLKKRNATRSKNFAIWKENKRQNISKSFHLRKKQREFLKICYLKKKERNKIYKRCYIEKTNIITSKKFKIWKK